MNWDQIQGNWKQVTGKAKVQWGKLTNDDLEIVAGHRDQLAGKIRELRRRQGRCREADLRVARQGNRFVVHEVVVGCEAEAGVKFISRSGRATAFTYSQLQGEENGTPTFLLSPLPLYELPP